MKVRIQSDCLNIFEALPADLIEQSTLITKKKGEFLYQKGEKPNGFFFIKSGIIALTDVSPNGSESLFRVFSRNFFLGYRSFLVSEEYHANALALSDTTVLKLSIKDIFELQNSYPAVLVHITQMLARDLRIAEERFNDITGKRVASRIIEALVFLQQRQPDYTWTRREIGEFCGAKTETVTRTFTQLEKEGLLEKSGRDILVSSYEALLDYKSSIDLEG